MTISSSPIQQPTMGTTTTTSLVTTIAAASSGNTLIAVFSTGINTVTITSISQTNVTWTRGPHINTTQSLEIWYGVVAGGASGTTATATIVNPASATVRCAISEWSGVNTSSQLDASGTNTGTSANPATGNFTALPDLNELFIAVGREAGTLNSGPTNGFTAGTQSSVPWAWKVVPSTGGPDSTDWTYSASSAWDVAYATFKGPAVARKQKSLAVRQAVNRASYW